MMEEPFLMIDQFQPKFSESAAYSESPHIWSPSFAFRIYDLVLPAEIEAKGDLGDNTRFEFPFNNPKKSPSDARREVFAGLTGLAETTLLFLSSLHSIRWQFADGQNGEVKRILHADNHVEVVRQSNGRTVANSHFLLFSQPVIGLEKQQVAIAFELERLRSTAERIERMPLHLQFKIVPAAPGRVSVFFPAEKESSNLRFHLHAPFVPELSRASIKETASNVPLFRQLATLTASSLHVIRGFNLLTAEFLGVLPNAHDSIPPRYQVIRSAIIDEMRNSALTPTFLKAHAPAKHLLQAKASLKELLTVDDLAFIFGNDGVSRDWAVGATRTNSEVDRFLSALGIKEWDVSEFVEYIQTRAESGMIQKPNPDFMRWFSRKSGEWHQQLYHIIREDLNSGAESRRRQVLENLRRLSIVRLNDGSYGVGRDCFFPGESEHFDDILARVAKGIYSSGTSRVQQEGAKRFLEDIGVRNAGEAEEIEAILKLRYGNVKCAPCRNDLERFIALVEKEPQRAKLFCDYFVLETGDGVMAKPISLFLDFPYKATGLTAFYESFGKYAARKPLSPKYLEMTDAITSARLARFAELIGVQVRLEIKIVSCHENPASRDFVRNAPGKWSPSYGIDRDYRIEGLKDLLLRPNEALSRLVWRTVCERTDIPWLKAIFRNNSNVPQTESSSQLVCILRGAKWVPLTDGRFVRPSEASRELLPAGFTFDEGFEWLKEVGFGSEEQKRSDDHKKQQATAKDLGFPDVECLERAKRFASLPPSEQVRVLAEIERRNNQDLPDQQSPDPERRARLVEIEASTAPERLAETRSRAVSVGREDVKQDAGQYLRELYTIDGKMICQICRDELPFKLENGNYYFEKVEFISELKRHHRQNYLALCPLHSAMFQHANSSRDLIKQLFSRIDGRVLQIILAQAEATIYFTETHLLDLRAVLSADAKLA